MFPRCHFAAVFFAPIYFPPVEEDGPPVDTTGHGTPSGEGGRRRRPVQVYGDNGPAPELRWPEDGGAGSPPAPQTPDAVPAAPEPQTGATRDSLPRQLGPMIATAANRAAMLEAFNAEGLALTAAQLKAAHAAMLAIDDEDAILALLLS